MKLSFFTSLCIFIFWSVPFQRTNAEVIVRYAHPSSISSDNFYLDIDSNGVNDYKISLSEDPWTVEIIGLNYDEIETDEYSYAIPLDAHTTVGTNEFETSAIIFEESAYFHSGARKYLGLRFQKDGATHYGYFEIEPERTSYESGTLHLYAYAYETVADTPIITPGVSPVGIETAFSADDFKVTLLNGRITVNTFGNNIEIARLELTDLGGRTIRTTVQPAEPLDITGLPAQMYLLSVVDKTARRIVRKVVL